MDLLLYSQGSSLPHWSFNLLSSTIKTQVSLNVLCWLRMKEVMSITWKAAQLLNVIPISCMLPLWNLLLWKMQRLNIPQFKTGTPETKAKAEFTNFRHKAWKVCWKKIQNILDKLESGSAITEIPQCHFTGWSIRRIFTVCFDSWLYTGGYWNKMIHIGKIQKHNYLEGFRAGHSKIVTVAWWRFCHLQKMLVTIPNVIHAGGWSLGANTYPYLETKKNPTATVRHRSHHVSYQAKIKSSIFNLVAWI